MAVLFPPSVFALPPQGPLRPTVTPTQTPKPIDAVWKEALPEVVLWEVTMAEKSHLIRSDAKTA